MWTARAIASTKRIRTFVTIRKKCLSGTAALPWRAQMGKPAASWILGPSNLSKHIRHNQRQWPWSSHQGYQSKLEGGKAIWLCWESSNAEEKGNSRNKSVFQPVLIHHVGFCMRQKDGIANLMRIPVIYFQEIEDRSDIMKQEESRTNTMIKKILTEITSSRINVSKPD